MKRSDSQGVWLVCKAEACVDPVVASGYCRSHYYRFRRYGDASYKKPRPIQPPKVKRIPLKVSERLPTEITSPSELGRVMGFSRQRAHQLLNQDKHRARGVVKKAIKAGVIAAPPFCLRCGETDKRLEAHHWSYDRPLDVGWFCPACHAFIHPHGNTTPR